MNQTITLSENLLNKMKEIQDCSVANKRKVAAILFKDGKILSTGYNNNLVNNGVCENTDGDTYDTVIHAESACIFNALKKQRDDIVDCNLLVSYSPCIECSKQIVLSDIIKNVFIYEEHTVNFRKEQFIKDSLSPLDFLLESGINVYIFNKVLNKFVRQNQRKLCVYHSKDLDGFMSRYLFNRYFANNCYDYAGYNYEEEAEWMDKNYSEIVFVDITPPVKWLKRQADKKVNIRIFDHHKNTIQNIVDSLNPKYIPTIDKHLVKYELTNNIKLITNGNECDSGCMILFRFAELPEFDIENNPFYFTRLISDYDTWHFTKIDNETYKQELLSIIESLKTCTYTEFEKLIDNDSTELRKRLDYSGIMLRMKQQKNVQDRINQGIILEFADIVLIAAESYPDYETESILRNNYKNKQIIYIGYSIDLRNEKVIFSVRNYPINKDEEIDALAIACYFNGGGHPNASGFTLPIETGLSLITSRFEEIKNLIIEENE